jgi:uncharacterized protein (TIGR02001 family)
MHTLPAASACAWLLAPVVAYAEDSWGGSLALTSDYRVRGISQTRGEPAIQGGVHGRLGSQWVAGVWASTINRNRGRSATSEVDAYLGFAWSLSPDWDAKIFATHYWYPNDPARARYDYDELSMSIVYRSQLVASIAWSPNTVYFGYRDSSWRTERAASASYELTGLQPITSSLSLAAGVGYNDLRRLFDRGYWYWNLGVAYAMGPVRLDLSRIDSDATAQELFGETVTDAGWSAAISWRF